MHPSTSSESEAQQADFQLIELGAELVEVVEMRRYLCSLIMNSYLHFYLPYNKIVTNYQAVFLLICHKTCFFCRFFLERNDARPCVSTCQQIVTQQKSCPLYPTSVCPIIHCYLLNYEPHYVFLTDSEKKSSL